MEEPTEGGSRGRWVEGGAGKQGKWRAGGPPRWGTKRQAGGGTDDQGDEGREEGWRGAQVGYLEASGGTERGKEGRREAQMRG